MPTPRQRACRRCCRRTGPMWQPSALPCQSPSSIASRGRRTRTAGTRGHGPQHLWPATTWMRNLRCCAWLLACRILRGRRLGLARCCALPRTHRTRSTTPLGGCWAGCCKPSARSTHSCWPAAATATVPPFQTTCSGSAAPWLHTWRCWASPCGPSTSPATCPTILLHPPCGTNSWWSCWRATHPVCWQSGRRLRSIACAKSWASPRRGWHLLPRNGPTTSGNLRSMRTS
mmetsp:Transcript_18617/g.47694  ORF Transcript_18617/g.47694 Transcript_18617/m.47694 type:complete len:230 (-) Transcript_18617:1914-2603(-)